MGKWTVFSPPIVDLCLAEPESAELVAAEDPLYYLEKNVDGFIPTLGAKTRRKGGRLQLAGSPSVHWSAPSGGARLGTGRDQAGIKGTLARNISVVIFPSRSRNGIRRLPSPETPR